MLPAQAWLIDDEEMKTAWERIRPSSIGFTTIVPLLIDEEYVSFSSLVLVVEQEVTDDFINWCRVGFSIDCRHDRVGGTVKWFDVPCKAKFSKTEYINTLDFFKKLSETEWV